MQRSKSVCPYTLKPILEIRRTSKEHILPEAIGGPGDYVVRADTDENSWFGANVDCLFNDCFLIRFARTTLGISGKTGIPDLKLKGKTAESGEAVDVTVSHAKPHKISHVKRGGYNKETRHGYAIVTGSEIDSEKERIRARFGKKGATVVFKEPKPLDSGPVLTSSDMELAVLRAGILKIAYLGAFEALGDDFLRDPSNSEWQKAIRATTHESRIGIRLYGQCPVQDAEGRVAQLPPTELHHHVLSVFCNSGTPLVSVKLFGNDALTCLCWLSTTSSLGMKHGEQFHVTCDALAKRVQKIFFRGPRDIGIRF
jgi:hypothetical protein